MDALTAAIFSGTPPFLGCPACFLGSADPFDQIRNCHEDSNQTAYKKHLRRYHIVIVFKERSNNKASMLTLTLHDEHEYLK